MDNRAMPTVDEWEMLEIEKNMDGHPKWACPSIYLRIIVASKSYGVMVWIVTLPH